MEETIKKMITEKKLLKIRYPINFKVDFYFYKRLYDFCEENDIPISEFLRQIVKKELDKVEVIRE